MQNEEEITELDRIRFPRIVGKVLGKGKGYVPYIISWEPETEDDYHKRIRRLKSAKDINPKADE